MKEWMKYLRLTILSLIIIIGGFCILAIGVETIFGNDVEELKSKVEKNKESIRVYEVGSPLTFSITPEFDSPNLPANPIYLTIEKNIIFDGDVVKITANAENVQDHVLEIALILNDGTVSLTNKTGDEIQFEVDYAKKHHLLLVLNPHTQPPFYDEIHTKFSKSGTSFHVAGGIILNNSSFDTLHNSNELFTIYSQADKLDVETNKAILEQIDQTKLNNIQQEITNQIFLGLSIIGIAVIPILGGFDFLFRIHFR